MKHNLTHEWIESRKCLPPKGTARLDIFDANPKGKGLCLRTSSDGGRVWYFCFTSPKPGGKYARQKFGFFPGTSLDAARTIAAEKQGLVDAGTDPRDARSRPAISPWRNCSICASKTCWPWTRKTITKPASPKNG